LKQELIIHKETIKNSQIERGGLIKTISFLSQSTPPIQSFTAFTMNHCGEGRSPGHSGNGGNEHIIIVNDDSQLEPNVQKSKKTKRKNSKRQGNIEASNNTNHTNSQNDDSDETQHAARLNNAHQRRNRQTTVIVGDSIVSKLEGWRMSNRENRVVVHPHSGATVDDLKDYIKPVLSIIQPASHQ